MLNFDRSTVKHGAQNIQNACHQWLFDTEFVFAPYSLAGLRGLRLKGGKGRKRGKKKKKGRGNIREGPAPFVNPWIRPVPDVQNDFFHNKINNYYMTNFSKLDHLVVLFGLGSI